MTGLGPGGWRVFVGTENSADWPVCQLTTCLPLWLMSSLPPTTTSHFKTIYTQATLPHTIALISHDSFEQNIIGISFPIPRRRKLYSQRHITSPKGTQEMVNTKHTPLPPCAELSPPHTQLAKPTSQPAFVTAMSTCESSCLASTAPVISAAHPPTALQAHASADLKVWRDAETSGGLLFPGPLCYTQTKELSGPNPGSMAPEPEA